MNKFILSEEDLLEQARAVLASLGEGTISVSAYDTAWVARLPHPNAPLEPLYPIAYEWLLRHQWADGSWGAITSSPHDRVLSTLAALLTLTSSTHRRVESEPRARKAIVYLNREGKAIRDDPAETVGFELVLPELERQARSLNLHLPYDSWKFIEHVRSDKLKRIPPVAVYGGPTPLTYSMEYLGDGISGALAPRCRLINGSYGVSPAATAFVHLHSPTRETEAYLERVLKIHGNGAVPTFFPFEAYETSWVLHLLGPMVAYLDGIPELIQRLKDAWTPMGVAWTSESSVTDADDTAVVAKVLTDCGHALDTGVFELFETSEYFQTFAYERDPSVTTNAHVLAALRRYPGTPARRRMILKVMQFLRSSRIDGTYWRDKWHISPFYAVDQVLEAVGGLADDLVRSSVGWILDRQAEDGSWGRAGGTQEETAWAVHTLLLAGARDKSLHELCRSAVDRGVQYLFEHYGAPNYPELWVAKTLNTPPNIVWAVIVSTLWLWLRDRHGLAAPVKHGTSA